MENIVEVLCFPPTSPNLRTTNTHTLLNMLYQDSQSLFFCGLILKISYNNYYRYILLLILTEIWVNRIIVQFVIKELVLIISAITMVISYITYMHWPYLLISIFGLWVSGIVNYYFVKDQILKSINLPYPKLTYIQIPMQEWIFYWQNNNLFART